MRVVTVEQMREADLRGCERLGEVALMRAAGKRIAETIELLEERWSLGKGPLVAFAGPGNNGGDAFAAFAEVSRKRERIIYAMKAPIPSGARRDAERRAHARGVETRSFPTTRAATAEALQGAALALDALLGTGGRSEPNEAMRPAVEALNAFDPYRVLAVDVPTGADATTGAVNSHTVRAGTTLMLGAPKLGLLIEPARTFAGWVLNGDIGIADELAALAGPRFETLDEVEFLAMLPERDGNTDKRGAGAPLIVAGSRQFPGAAVLSARAAARAGAGYVTVACPEDTAGVLRHHLIEQVVVGYDPREPAKAIETLCDLTNHASSVAIGPGLGLSDEMGAIVRGFVARLELPVVLDAGALFHFAKHLELLRGKRCVLTPHAGEFGRLSGEGTLDPATRVERLRSFVDRTGITTLLKGSATLIADGTTMHVNATGTNALATAGTGDVLSGMIATLLAQGLAPVDAARAAAYWHGAAGRIAGATRPRGVVAGDVIEMLAMPFHEPLDPRPNRRVRPLSRF